MHILKYKKNSFRFIYNKKNKIIYIADLKFFIIEILKDDRKFDDNIIKDHLPNWIML